MSFFKEGEISPRRASPPNRASSPPYEQPLKTDNRSVISGVTSDKLLEKRNVAVPFISNLNS